MKKIVFGCLGAAAVAFALQFTPANVQAHGFLAPCDAVACDPCAPCGDGSDGCAPVKAGGWFLNGHIEAGFYANTHGNTSNYTNPGFGYGPGFGTFVNRGADYTTGNTGYLQNTRLTGAQVNQVYLSMGKAVDGSRGLDIGGTVDFTWGSDAYLTQARGMEFGAGHGINGTTEGRWGTGDYFASFAQAYVELAYKRWNFVAGKFYAPFGSDDYRSTNNFFYSWSLNNSINPQVGGGAYASYKVSDKLIAIGGWVMPEEIGESSDNNALLGGLVWIPGKNFNLRYAFAAGENKYAIPSTSLEYFTHSLTANTQLSKRLKYVFDWSYFQVDGFQYAWGLNNEIIYQANKQWAFGTRFGMLRPDESSAQSQRDRDMEIYTVALGANWTPNEWLTVKPEIRYDWTDKGAIADRTLFNGSENTYQLSGGMSAVVKF